MSIALLPVSPGQGDVRSRPTQEAAIDDDGEASAHARASTREPPRRSAGRSAVASTEIDTRLIGMIVAPWPRSGSAFHILSRRRLPHRPQPVEPVGPEHLDRDHGHGHGADHRVAQHRPVGRLAARASSATRWRWCRPTGSRFFARRRRGFDQPVHRGSSRWPSAWCSAPLIGGAAGLHRRLRGCPRSSSRSAGSSSGAA